MKVDLRSILNQKKVNLDRNGIWLTELKLSEEAAVSQSAWEQIYDFDSKKLNRDRVNFNKTKMKDHMKYIAPTFSFGSGTVYLEIGCGPAYIGEYLMKEYKVKFVGVDFNYPMLLTLKKYFDEKGYKNYILIHADINDIPIKNNSIDYIYGGGVIEHLPNTSHLIQEMYRILKKGGVAFNTVPAFSLWWVFRFFNNIPDLPVLRSLFEFTHIKLLNGKILEKYYGYELSYTINRLRFLHNKNKFKDIHISAFAFYPAKEKLNNKLLRKLYYLIQTSTLTTAVFYVWAKK